MVAKSFSFGARLSVALFLTAVLVDGRIYGVTISTVSGGPDFDSSGIVD